MYRQLADVVLLVSLPVAGLHAGGEHRGRAGGPQAAVQHDAPRRAPCSAGSGARGRAGKRRAAAGGRRGGDRHRLRRVRDVRDHAASAPASRRQTPPTTCSPRPGSRSPSASSRPRSRCCDASPAPRWRETNDHREDLVPSLPTCFPPLCFPPLCSPPAPACSPPGPPSEEHPFACSPSSVSPAGDNSLTPRSVTCGLYLWRNERERTWLSEISDFCH